MADSVNIVGNLTKLHIPPSNFDVYPFIGITNNTPLFSTNYEVQKILEVDLKLFSTLQLVLIKNTASHRK